MLGMKEMLSSAGGFYPSSMAFIIGGIAHGQLRPVDREQPNFTNGGEHYSLFPVVIDDENWMEVWRLDTMTVDEVNAVAVAVAYQQHEKILEDLLQ